MKFIGARQEIKHWDLIGLRLDLSIEDRVLVDLKAKNKIAASTCQKSLTVGTEEI